MHRSPCSQYEVTEAQPLQWSLHGREEPHTQAHLGQQGSRSLHLLRRRWLDDHPVRQGLWGVRLGAIYRVHHSSPPSCQGRQDRGLPAQDTPTWREGRPLRPHSGKRRG